MKKQVKYVFKPHLGGMVVVIICVALMIGTIWVTVGNKLVLKDVREMLNYYNELQSVSNAMTIKEACDTKYVNKIIRVVGFLGGTMAEDGTMAWLLEQPFMSYDSFNQEGIPKICLVGTNFEYTEHAVIVSGMLATNSDNEWYLRAAQISDYDSGEMDRLDQFNYLIDYTIAATFEELAQHSYSVLYEDVSRSTLDTEELEHSILHLEEYAGYELIDEAKGLADELVSLCNELKEDEDFKDKLSDYRSRASEVYERYYNMVSTAGEGIVYDVPTGESSDDIETIE